MMIRPLLTTLALLTAAPLLGRDTMPEATPDGPEVGCITRHAIRNTYVRSDRVIDFEMIGHRYYRNTLPADCPGLGFEERFGYSTSIDQLCSSDIITVIYTSPMQTGARCGLGRFQPVKIAPRIRKR